MSINFSTLQGLTIPEGVVTQIADASGRVLWSAVKSVLIVLQVEKITATTYAGGTSYADEQFILLDIYPKTNGTVKVTYGGLTKTITDTSGVESPNAQKIYFGTFNGVSDSVTTPASGELVIEGAYAAFACGTYQKGSKSTNVGRCGCVTAVSEWGSIEYLPTYAFTQCQRLLVVNLPEGLLSIGEYAFSDCSSLTNVTIPNSVTSIGNFAFYGCNNLVLCALPEGLLSIGISAFKECRSMTLSVLPDSVASIGTDAFYNCEKITLTTLPSELKIVNKDAFRFYQNSSSTIKPNPSMHTMTFHSGIEEICETAFSHYKSGTEYCYLTRIIMLSPTPPIMSGYYDAGTSSTSFGAFGGITANTQLEIIVPKGSIDAYRAADGWSIYGKWIDFYVEAS